MKECTICGKKIRKGYSLILEQFLNSVTDRVEYTFCPSDAPAAAELFRAEVMSRV